MIRNGHKTIIFLINNGGYTIEVEIHDGPYNIIKNWNYTALVEAFHNGEGKLYTCKVSLCTLCFTSHILFNKDKVWEGQKSYVNSLKKFCCGLCYGVICDAILS